METFKWPVVPLCERQLRDVRPEDIIRDKQGLPLARLCTIDNAGGGYDRFREIYEKRYHRDTGNRHVVVQLQGCTLECPWCYVTQDGIWGTPSSLTTDQLYWALFDPLEDISSVNVLHLMGGAPALYLNYWEKLLELLWWYKVKDTPVFHSDFLLNEGIYDRNVLSRIAEWKNQLHAVSLKPHTGPLTRLQLENFLSLEACGVPFYLTFTGSSMAQCTDTDTRRVEALKKQILQAGLSKEVFDDFTYIPLKYYEALKGVTLGDI